MTAVERLRLTAVARSRSMAAVATVGRAVGLRADRQLMASLDLVSSSAIGALFGLLFWLVAARGFDEATVGVNAALITTMMQAAGVASLGLPNALVRFVPIFGSRAPRLVGGSYLVAGTVTMILALGVGAWLGSHYGELSLLRSAEGVVAFALACVAWQLFALQDSVLVGIGRSRAVPIENTVFSLAKLGLLAAAVAMVPRWGIFAAWVAPLAIVILVVNLVIVRHFRSTIGAASADAAPRSEPALQSADLVRFAVGDHGSTLLWMGAVGALPLLVLDRLGDEANAYYAVSWAIAYNLLLVSTNVGTAFIAEAANDPDRLSSQRAAAMRQAGLLVVPASLIVWVLAPHLLRIFGAAYADEGSTVLRLLAMAAVAHVPVAVSMAALRAERRVRAVFFVAAAEVALIGVVTAVTIDRMGVAGVGLAWLVAEVVLSVVLLAAQPTNGLGRALRSMIDAVAGRDPLAAARLRSAGLLIISVEAVVIALLALSPVSTELLDDIGLVSVLPPVTVVAALVVIGTAGVVICRPVFEERWAAGHVAAVVVLLSAAPSVAYETVRYPWSYKHIGIVDFILRHHGVDRHVEPLNVYHNWPGFFAGFATLTDLSGLDRPLLLARWAPVSFNLLVLVALVFVLRQLGPSRRVAWLGCLLFFLTNWIGQDYFAPQALGLVLHLIILGLVLRFHRRGASLEPTVATWAVLALATLALVSSHQLTPFFLLSTLAGLVLIRQIPVRLPILVGACLTAWVVLGAWPFLAANLPTYLETIGSPSGNAAQSFGLAAERSGGQVVVATAGRVLLAGLGALAAVGAMRAIRRPDRDLTPFVLAAAPLPGLFLAFGGEILFRVVLFMLPALAWFAADALLAVRPVRFRPTALAAVAIAALVPFSLAYYGKDSFYTFTEDEVGLVEELSTTAPDHSLLIEGNRNYPAQFVDYEKFVYVPIAQEPTETIESVSADPAGELHRWMVDGGYAASYVLLTSGQQAEVEAVGSLPASLLPRIERALRRDERFVIALENDAGVVFTLAGPP